MRSVHHVTNRGAHRLATPGLFTPMGLSPSHRLINPFANTFIGYIPFVNSTMKSTPDVNPLAVVATYLTARRDAILNKWRTRCEADPSLGGVTSLSREEFNNKVPFILNTFDQRLRGEPPTNQVGLLAAEHGLHRWQKGYALHELAVEMQHLNDVLLAEFNQCWDFYSDLDQTAIVDAYERLAHFSNQISMASIEQYTALQRQSAASRVDALEKTLTQLNQASRQRGDRLRHSSHDLRGTFSIINTSAELLEMAGDSEPERKQFLDMLLRNLATSRTLVTELIDLARLEADQEHLQIQSFNAGELLAQLVISYQPLARERGLQLLADGPADLAVEGDPTHLQRILQNLVLNALQHTPSGWVSVSWTRDGDARWLVSVQDTGPGLPLANEVGSLAQVLNPSPESSAAFGIANPAADAREALNTRASGTAISLQGEGIGLSIVKGLCELLRASLEIESKPGAGTLFRIRQSIHWHL
jgi:signal transduction histidine kinase